MIYENILIIWLHRRKITIGKGGDRMSVSRHRTDYWIKNHNVDVSIKTISGHVDVHWHEFYEIELILYGAGTYNVDGIDYDISPGKLFLMSPSSYHYIDFTQDTEIINFMFVPDVGDRDFLCHIFSASPHVAMNLSESDTRFVYTLAENMVKNNFLPYLSYSINCLLGKLLLLHSPEPITTEDAQMKYAILYIHNHYRQNITLEDAANVAHYSQNYFGNKFKKYVGVPFKAYVTDLRFSLALKMLENTNLPSMEICYSCGFTDYSNFMYYFKKRYGMTPKEYREKKK